MEITLPRFDLLIVGGGINGVGIARDAAGRGLSVLLVEQHALAAHTSSASTKLIHGGLRYLETYEFRLVREALNERRTLLNIAPHLVHPLNFVLPQAPHVRPGWLIRIGLFLYDRLGKRGDLPRSRAVSLAPGHFGDGLKPEYRRGFVYADAQADDRGLVQANAVGAQARGAEIRTGVTFLAASPVENGWMAKLREGDSVRTVHADVIVNAAGAWVGDVLGHIAGAPPELPPRLIKGSHILVPRIHAGEHAYIFQNPDRRVVFAIPWQGKFTLIGTTDVEWHGNPSSPHITDEEIDYLCAAVNFWLLKPISRADVVDSFAGIRSLYDDGAPNASQVTRDYVLAFAPRLVSVFGGKITTYRVLAEHVLAAFGRYFPHMGPPWTADAPLEKADG